MKVLIRRKKIIVATAVVALMLCSPITAQDAATAGNADAKWQDLKSKIIPPSAITSSDKPMDEQKRLELVGHFKKMALDLGKFREENQAHGKALEAALEQAKCLLRAAYLGDSESEQSSLPLVELVRNDERLPSSARFQVEALSEQLLIRSLAKSSAEAQLARQHSARYLMSRYPSEAGGYDLLLATADTSEDQMKVAEVVREVLGSDAPFSSKAKATVIKERWELLGKNLNNVANTALGRGTFFTSQGGKKILVYTWATWSRPSLDFAAKLKAEKSQEYELIGFNLDTDVSKAKAVAEQAGLTGKQFYEGAGKGGRLALLLKLDRVGRVYLTDDTGAITSVTGELREKAPKKKEAGS